MPHIPAPKSRKQRLKSAALPAKEPTVSAAVSIAEPLYMKALHAAKASNEGNFSAYVRRLIRRDLNVA